MNYNATIHHNFIINPVVYGSIPPPEEIYMEFGHVITDFVGASVDDGILIYNSDLCSNNNVSNFNITDNFTSNYNLIASIGLLSGTNDNSSITTMQNRQPLMKVSNIFGRQTTFSISNLNNGVITNLNVILFTLYFYW
jgi:hypothetical protein